MGFKVTINFLCSPICSRNAWGIS